MRRVRRMDENFGKEKTWHRRGCCHTCTGCERLKPFAFSWLTNRTWTLKKKLRGSWAHNNKKKHFVDLKLGNLMVQRVTRCETRQGMEICSIISAYLSAFAEQHHQSSANDPVPTLLA